MVHLICTALNRECLIPCLILGECDSRKIIRVIQDSRFSSYALHGNLSSPAPTKAEAEAFPWLG